MGGLVTFPFNADEVVNFQMCGFPARSTRTAANWYTRITGVAGFYVDPDWEYHDWHRGTTSRSSRAASQNGIVCSSAAVSAMTVGNTPRRGPLTSVPLISSSPPQNGAAHRQQ